LHQIENNPDHISVVQGLRDWGGVVTLHDQNLHYLYEIAGTDAFRFYSGMAATSRDLGAAFARHWRDGELIPKCVEARDIRIIDQGGLLTLRVTRRNCAGISPPMQWVSFWRSAFRERLRRRSSSCRRNGCSLNLTADRRDSDAAHASRSIQRRFAR
jgi:hypothetical protein